MYEFKLKSTKKKVEEEEDRMNENQMVYIYHLDSVFINHGADTLARLDLQTHTHTICNKSKMEISIMGIVPSFAPFISFFFLILCRQKE